MIGSNPIPALARRTGLTKGALTAISTIVPVGIAIGLLPPLLALTLSDRGASERIIGLLVALMAGAALFATPYAATLGAKYGVGRTIAGMILLAAIMVPIFWLIDHIAILLPLAFIYGASMAICFALSEYWINAATPTKRRGLVMGVYATLLSIGFATGPALLVVVGIGSIRPFLLGSAILLVSAIPAILGRRKAPEFHAPESRNFIRFIIAVPTATLGVLVFAAAEIAGFSFLPLWGKHLGYPLALLPLLASAMTLGNVMFQIPLGLLADRVDRRHILLVLGIVGCLGMLLALEVSHSPRLLIPVLFFWGGAIAGLYTVGLAHLAHRFKGSDLAGATSAFVFCYAVGMLCGPLMQGEAMTRFPTNGFPLVLSAIFAAYSVFVALRIFTARP